MRNASLITSWAAALLVICGISLGEQPPRSGSSWGVSERIPASTESSPYTIEDLSKLVQQVTRTDNLVNRVAKHGYTTIESFLPLLPTSLRRNPVLMKSSRSSQSASPTRPRVLLSTPDSTFILSFVGDDYISNRLEVIQFDRATARFEFAEVDFETEKSPSMIRNSLQCGGCHGNPGDLRPNFESFSEWTGTFGEHGEKIAPKSLEENQLKSFITSAKTDPRYQSLFDLEQTHLERDRNGTMSGHANANMNQNLVHLNAKRVARIVRENSADYSKAKFGLLASLYCADGNTKNFIQTFFKERTDRAPENLGSIENIGPDQPAAFFWAAAPRSGNAFFWTTSFGDMMNKESVRTRASATLDYANALIEGDADLKAIPRERVKLKNGSATLPSCYSLEKAALQLG